MYDAVRVKINKTFGHIQHLDKITLSIKCNYKKRLTRLVRLASGFFSMNSIRVPFDIHSETICKGFVVTPTKGAMFGCLNLPHMEASSKNHYNT